MSDQEHVCAACGATTRERMAEPDAADLTGRHITVWHGPEVTAAMSEALFDAVADAVANFTELDAIVISGPTDREGNPV